MEPYQVCADCAIFVANGDLTGIDDATREREVEQAEGEWYLGDAEIEFSWAPCDRCGCSLGGARYEAHLHTHELSPAERRRTERAERLAQARQREHKRFYVVAIGTDRVYGGPEEGGWYYDASEILDVRSAFDVATGLQAARALREEFPTCPHGRYSVIGGTDVEIRMVRTPEALAQLEADCVESQKRQRYC